MGFNRVIGYMGVAIQSAKGTAASAAKFKFPIYSGGIPVTKELADEEISTASRNQGDPYVSGVIVPVEFETRAFVGSFVMLMQAALGARTTTGASDPYSHAIATGAVPYLTFWCSMGASDAVSTMAQDVKLDTLELTWTGPSACRLAVKGFGTTADMTAADFDATAIDETDGDGYFFPVGGTFQWDAVGATAADFVCEAGGLAISNNLERVNHCGMVTAYDHDEGKLGAAFSLTTVPANADAWIETLTGAANGSAPDGDVYFGKVNIVLQEAGTGTHTTTIVASRVPWEIPPLTIDASNGKYTSEVSGSARYNSTESDALDVTITNANAAAVYVAA
jgi:hypothetical protein